MRDVSHHYLAELHILIRSCRFRWIVCQVEALRNCFPSAILRALDDLPKSLDETYDRILLGIPQERRGYAQRFLHCLSVAIRPLRVEELAEILAIKFDAGAFPHYDVNWRPENSEEAVLLACSSLITIVNVHGLRVVQFPYFSVKEYLISERLGNAPGHLSRYHVHPHSAHTILAQVSLCALLALDSHVDKESVKNFPLSIYAARFWVRHAKFDDVSSRVEDAVTPFRPRQATLRNMGLDLRHRPSISGRIVCAAPDASEGCPIILCCIMWLLWPCEASN